MSDRAYAIIITAICLSLFGGFVVMTIKPSIPKSSNSSSFLD